MNDFERLVKTLKDNGYTVEVRRHKIYDFAKIEGNNIVGGFCSKHDENDINASYTYINGKIAIDHIDCFDKWRNCPLNLPIPNNDVQMDYLLNQLKFWGSYEGYRASDEYDFDKWVNNYPSE
jgi:hypothetical protein